MKEKKILFKKLMLIAIPLFLVVPNINATQLFEHWLEDDGYASVYNDNIWGQQITIGATGNNQNFILHNIVIKCCRDIEAQPGIAILKMYRMDKNGHPRKIPISYGSFDADTITTEYSGEEITIIMKPTMLHKNSKYVFTLNVPDGDGYNKVKLRCIEDTEEEPHELYSGGLGIRSTDNGNSWNTIKLSFYFKLFGIVK